MAIKPPNWCKTAVPSLRGWRHHRTGELLKATKISQAEIDEFAVNYPNCTELNSSITLADEGIYNLQGLSNIEIINGNFTSSHVIGLSNLSGLENLQTINGDLYLAGAGFSSFQGIENLNTITGQLTISSGVTVGDLTDFESLSTLGSFQLRWTEMPSINGLQNLTEINSIYINNNTQLEDLQGLNNLTTVINDLEIANSLETINGLESLTTVGGYFQLETGVETIAPLSNLEFVGGELWLFGLNAENVDALSSINYLGGLFVSNSWNDVEGITDFSGLSHLTQIHGPFKFDDTSISNFNDFTNLTRIDITQPEFNRHYRT